MIAVFLMAVFYEGLKTLREVLLYWDMKQSKKGSSMINTRSIEYEALDANDSRAPPRR